MSVATLQRLCGRNARSLANSRHQICKQGLGPNVYWTILEPDGGVSDVFVSNCAEDGETLLVGQPVAFYQRRSPRSGKQEAIAVELLGCMQLSGALILPCIRFDYSR